MSLMFNYVLQLFWSKIIFKSISS